MAKLSSKERAHRVKVARRLLQSKARSKPFGKEFKRLNRIFKLGEKFRENGYEFAKAKSKISAKELSRNKALIQKIYPNAKPGKQIKGYFIPRQVAGPNPRIRFAKNSFTVGAKGIPESEFVPVEPAIFTGEDSDQTTIDRILEKFNGQDVLNPVAENGADLSQYGYARRKKELRKLLLDWIATYGWSQAAQKKGRVLTKKEADKLGLKSNDMGRWFAGIQVYKPMGGDDAEES